MTFQEIFKDLRQIDCSSHVEKTPEGFSYLSWAWAVDIIGQKYDWSYTEPELRVLPDGMGYEVSSSITIGGHTRSMWLPVLDGGNNPMTSEPWIRETRKGKKTVQKARSFDINTAKMRCLVKNLAMFGLGLYIYAGEDVPHPEPPVCEDCGRDIQPYGNMSSMNLADYTKKKYGRCLCSDCATKASENKEETI